MPVNRKKIATLATLLVIIGVLVSLHQAVNSPTIQKSIFRILAGGGIGLEFTSQDGRVKFRPLRNLIEAKDLSLTNRETGQTFKAKNIKIRYNLLGILRGRLILSKVNIEGFEARFTAVKIAAKKEKKISVKKLFILRNLVIENGSLRDAEFVFPDNGRLLTDILAFEFTPHLTGEVGMKLNLQGVSFNGKNNNMSAGGFSVDGKTKLAEWYDTPPYVNSLSGRLAIQDFSAGKISVSSLSAGIDVDGMNFRLKDIELISKKRKMTGELGLNMEKRDYRASVRIAEPLPFPALGDENPVIDTSGEIQGELTLEGRGLTLNENSGAAKLKLTHSKEPFIPIVLDAAVSWKNGTAVLEKALLSLNGGLISAGGFINIPAKKFDIKFEAGDVPLDAVFGRFGDKHFHPIFGTADAHAHLTGWGRDFHVIGEADTKGISGYHLIETDHAHVKIDATYHELNLRGEVDQNGKKTGDVTLKIKYGTKEKGKPRPKNLRLEARVTNNSLGISMGAYKLHGIGSGELILDGPQKAYKGRLSAVIENGSFLDIPFQRVSTAADFAYKKIKFTAGEFIIPNIQPVIFSSPVQMDFNDAGFHIYGRPIEGAAFDADYNSSNASWRLKEIVYHDLSASGTYAPKGSSNLNIAGTVEGEKLAVFKQFLREAEGPISARLHITGPISNPFLSGDISFNGTSIYPRKLNRRLDNLNGRLVFDGRTVKTDRLTGTIDDGRFSVNGAIQHENLAPQKFDIDFSGENLRYVSPDRFYRIEFNADAAWKGTRNSSTVSGDAVILDGRYTKDFVIFSGLAGAKQGEKAASVPAGDNIHLDLRIRNTGDFRIKNNIGDIWLKIDVNAKGTAAHPLITGAIETPEGKIHYLGKDFIITRGFAEFRDPYTNPYLEITAEHEVPNIPDMVIKITLHGPTNNLALDLSSTKPLDQRDIISLLLFGVTEQEAQDARYSSGFGASMAAGQITHMLEQPVTRLTHLDIFRVESGTTGQGASSSSQTPQISKIYMGKQLSDRLSFEFYTDVNSQNSQQNVRADYMLTDFLILKGESSTNQQYKFNISLRFRER